MTNTHIHSIGVWYIKRQPPISCNWMNIFFLLQNKEEECQQLIWLILISTLSLQLYLLIKYYPSAIILKLKRYLPKDARPGFHRAWPFPIWLSENFSHPPFHPALQNVNWRSFNTCLWSNKKFAKQYSIFHWCCILFAFLYY